MRKKELRILLSGGGTGGHIFPALAIADRIKQENPDTVFHFVGAKGKMEMQKVAEAGYSISGLPISGFQRGQLVVNLLLPFKVLISLLKAFLIILRFRPHAVIGTGGYASGPTMKAAAWMRIPVYIQEQNSYPGVTNKLMRKAAKKIYVAYPNLDRYFPKKKIMLTGNPVRDIFTSNKVDPISVRKKWGIAPNAKVILVIGGSQGALSINKSIHAGLKNIYGSNTNLIWQTGPAFFKKLSSEKDTLAKDKIFVQPFIKDMHEVYAIADLVISRAGATSISELTLMQCPTLFVPLPHAAENHQYKNAKVLADHEAAMIVEDKNAKEHLVKKALQLVVDDAKLEKFRKNIRNFAYPNAVQSIVRNILADLKYNK